MLEKVLQFIQGA